MEVILFLLIAAAVVGALKGLAWFVQAARDRRITALEWLEFIEYNMNLALQFLWLYIIFSYWGLLHATAPLTVTPGDLWTLAGFGILGGSLYYTFKRRYLTSSILVLAGLLIALWYQLVKLPDLVSFLTYLLAVLLGTQALAIAYRGLGR